MNIDPTLWVAVAIVGIGLGITFALDRIVKLLERIANALEQRR